MWEDRHKIQVRGHHAGAAEWVRPSNRTIRGSLRAQPRSETDVGKFIGVAITLSDLKPTILEGLS